MNATEVIGKSFLFFYKKKKSLLSFELLNQSSYDGWPEDELVLRS